MRRAGRSHRYRVMLGELTNNHLDMLIDTSVTVPGLRTNTDNYQIQKLHILKGSYLKRWAWWRMHLKQHLRSRRKWFSVSSRPV